MPSSSSVKIISLDRNKLLADLRQIAGRIRAEHAEVTEVRLFGSLARGDYTGTSDIDVLILLSQTNETDSLRRITSFLPYFTLARGCDLLVYTVAEIKGYLAENNRFVQRIMNESIPLL